MNSLSSKPQPGETIGTLTVCSRQYLAGGRLLVCRCQCGKFVRRWTRDVTEGRVEACPQCEAGQLWFRVFTVEGPKTSSCKTVPGSQAETP